MTSSASDFREPAVDLDGLFRRYSRELNTFACRRLKDPDAAADVVQDGFLRFLVWNRDRRGQPGATTPRFFLWSVVGNLTIDFIRRKRARGTFAALDEVANDIVDPYPTPDRWVEARQQYRLLKAALDELPERHRTALLLNRIEGLTHVEIGARLGVSASMVSKYIMSVLEHCLNRLAGGLR